MSINLDKIWFLLAHTACVYLQYRCRRDTIFADHSNIGC